jgi:hypothetical protein
MILSTPCDATGTALETTSAQVMAAVLNPLIFLPMS